MKGTYITLQSKCVKVLEFDEVNKMAYVDFGEGDIHWVGEPEYKEWATPTYVADIPAQIIEQAEEKLLEETIVEKEVKKPSKKK